MNYLYLLIIYLPFFTHAMETGANHTHETLKPLLEGPDHIEEIIANLCLPHALTVRVISKTTNKGVTNYLQKNAYKIFADRMQAPFYFNDTECENKIINTAFIQARNDNWHYNANRENQSPVNNPTVEEISLIFFANSNTVHISAFQKKKNLYKKIFLNYFYSTNFFSSILQKLSEINTIQENVLFYFNNSDITSIIQSNPTLTRNSFMVIEEKKYIKSCLELFIEQNNFDFIKNNVDIDFLYKRDSKGRTALHYAARHDKPNIFFELLEINFSINEQDYEGNTPFLLILSKYKLNKEFIMNILDQDIYVPNLLIQNYKNKNCLDLIDNYRKLNNYPKNPEKFNPKKRKKFYSNYPGLKNFCEIKNKIMALAEKQKNNQ